MFFIHRFSNGTKVINKGHLELFSLPNVHYVEFFFGPSYFSSCLRNVRFSARNFSTVRRKLTFSVCIASMTSRIDAISEVKLLNTCDMSVTCSFICTKIRKIFDICKQISMYFIDNQRLFVFRTTIFWAIVKLVLRQNLS